MRKSPRTIEEMYHDCTLSGKTKEECVGLIEPYINAYEDPEGVKRMISHYRRQRKEYESRKQKGLDALEQAKQDLKKLKGYSLK